jgi:hypothetical protein
VNSLDIIRVIVSPGPAHPPWTNVVWHDITIVREFGAADAAFTALGNDLSIEQLAHLAVRAELAVTSRMKWIVYSADAELSNCLRFRNFFPSAAETRTMDWADLVATESHDFSPKFRSCVRVRAAMQRELSVEWEKGLWVGLIIIALLIGIGLQGQRIR